MIRNNIFLITLLSVICSFWIFWYPGVKVATDYHLSFNAGVVGALPWSWREFNVADGMGEYTTFTLWSQPLQSLSEVLSFISLNDEVQTKLTGFVIIVFGFIGLWKLLAYWKINDWGKGIGATFFILNSFFLLMFDGGQFSLSLAYITLPFAIVSFMDLLETAKWKERVKFSFIFLLVSIFDIRIIFVLSIILGIYLIFRSDIIRLLPNLLTSSLFTLLILIGFHAYWIVPSLLSRAPYLPPTYDRLAQVNFLSFSSIGHSIFLQQPHWYKNIFGQINHLKFEFIAIPILVFLAPILIKKNFTIGFWLIIAIVGIFLSKGSQDPFPGVYLWLFGHFPGFSLFRDPVKFYFLTALAYSVLIGFSINAISKLRFFNKVINFGIKVFPYLTFLYLFFLARPIYLGWMTGMISKPIYSNEYKQLSNILEADHKFSRVLWVPSQSPLGHSSLDHPPIQASGIVNKRPFAVGTKGTYETLNFLREAPFMGQLLGVAGIGYTAYPYLDPRRDNLHPDNIKYYYLFLDQLSKRPWLSKVVDSPIPLFKVSEYQDKFFITPNIWWVVGSDSILNEATKSARLKLSQNALIFAEEYAGLSNRIDELPQAKIILNNKTNLDLAGSFINLSDLIFPAKDLDFEPNQSGWWKREGIDLIRWREFLKEKYEIDNQDFDLGGGWAVGEGSLKLKIRSKNFIKDKVFLARVLESTKSGNLSFYQGEKIIGKINTKKEGNNIRWFEVGKLMNNEDLTISSEGGINVVNALSVLDIKQWQSYQSKAIEYERSNRIVNFDDKHTEIHSVIVKYEQVNPTKYLVTISALSEPTLLIFSQNYDSLWNLNDKSSLPIYSLLNGFKIDKDGQYIVELKAQKFVYPGLIISGLTLGVLVLLLFKSSKPL